MTAGVSRDEHLVEAFLEDVRSAVQLTGQPYEYNLAAPEPDFTEGLRAEAANRLRRLGWAVDMPNLGSLGVGFIATPPRGLTATVHPNEIYRTVLRALYETYVDRVGKPGQWWITYGDPEFEKHALTVPQVRNAYNRLVDLGFLRRVGGEGATIADLGIRASENASLLEELLPLPGTHAGGAAKPFTPTEGPPMATTGITIFISHATADKPLAADLLRLIESAMDGQSHQIRCTSVEGHELPPGSDPATALRTELGGCSVVIGLLTATSLTSSYVLMELGAAWAFNRTTFQLMAPGVAYGDLPGPFKNIIALQMDSDGDLSRLIDAIGANTAFRMRNLAKVHGAISAFRKSLAAHGVSGVTPTPPFRP
jgi:hypothetical protein